MRVLTVIDLEPIECSFYLKILASCVDGITRKIVNFKNNVLRKWCAIRDANEIKRHMCKTEIDLQECLFGKFALSFVLR